MCYVGNVFVCVFVHVHARTWTRLCIYVLVRTAQSTCLWPALRLCVRYRSERVCQCLPKRPFCRSSLIKDMLTGVFPKCTFTIDGVEFTAVYLLADGIYPTWAIFIKPAPHASGTVLSQKLVHYNGKQEGVRKHIECCFGIIRRRFKVLRYSCELTTAERVTDMVVACFILHNMIVEMQLECGFGAEDVVGSVGDLAWERTPAEENARERFLRALERMREVQSTETAGQLHRALVNHLWDLKGNL